MRTARPQGSPAAPLVFAGAMVAALIMGVAAISVAWADDSTDVSVEVIASSATPTATPTSTSSSTVGGASTTNPGTGTGVVTQPGTTQSGSNPSPTSPTSTDPGVAGVLYVSGLSWSYLPSLNPLDGSLTLRFTVRNVYSETLTPTASLWINQVFGGPVGVPVAVPVDTLKAGETRTVEATFTGLAQWTMLSAHATLALPNKGDQVVTPISRDAVIWFLPWFVVLLAAAGAAGVLWRRLRPRPAIVTEPDAAVAELDETPGTDEL